MRISYQVRIDIEVYIPQFYNCSLFPDTALFIGIMTRQLLRRLENSGDISSQQVKAFHTAVRHFYCEAVTYAMQNLPLNDEVLLNSQFVNFERKESATITQVTFFLSRYNYVKQFVSASVLM